RRRREHAVRRHDGRRRSLRRRDLGDGQASLQEELKRAVAMSAYPDTAGQPVALVIQRRIADDGFAAFARWNGEVGEALKAWPGFLGQEVVPPRPPAHVDWVT